MNVETKAQYHKCKSRAREIYPPVPPPRDILSQCSSKKRSNPTSKAPNYSCKSKVESSVSAQFVISGITGNKGHITYLMLNKSLIQMFVRIIIPPAPEP
jgi:hypothetical protein